MTRSKPHRNAQEYVEAGWDTLVTTGEAQDLLGGVSYHTLYRLKGKGFFSEPRLGGRYSFLELQAYITGGSIEEGARAALLLRNDEEIPEIARRCGLAASALRRFRDGNGVLEPIPRELYSPLSTAQTMFLGKVFRLTGTQGRSTKSRR